jgi:hypothetical protein
MVCGMILAASPDTEHGDNLLWDITPAADRESLFFRFRRISEDKALKEKYGFDVSITKAGQMKADALKSKGAPEEIRDTIAYELGDVYLLSDGRKLGHVTELLTEHAGDKYYAGWCIMEIDGDGVRWFVDKFGKVRRDMTDPTLDNLTLLTKQQKV